MLNLESLVHSIQFASMQADVFEALKQGNSVLNALNAQTSLEEVEALMDDTREAVEYQQQVSKLMGSELSEEDAESIDAEIAEWERQEQEQAMAADVEGLPDVSATVPVDSTPAVVAPVAAAAKTKPKVATKQKEVVLA